VNDVFGDVRPNRRNLGDLMPLGLRVISHQNNTAAGAVRGTAFDNFINLFGRDQRAIMPRMARLPTPCTTTLGLRWLALGTRRIGRRRLGGIGRVLPELSLEAGILRFQFLNPSKEFEKQPDYLRRRAIENLLVQRQPSIHAPKLPQISKSFKSSP
jgi:hypothetical protein